MPDVREFIDVDRVAQRITPNFQKALLKAGWPKDLAASLTVKGHSSGILEPKYTGSATGFKQVQDLEFGTYDKPPTGAIFNHFMSNDAQQEILDESYAAIDGLIDRLARLFT